MSTSEPPSPTLEQLLAAVEIGILKLTRGAKSYTVGERTFTRENLADLRAWRTELKAEIAGESGDAVDIMEATF